MWRPHHAPVILVSLYARSGQAVKTYC